jgi:plastocyanin
MKSKARAITGLAALSIALAAGLGRADAEQWGGLKGRFVFDGPIPKPKAIAGLPPGCGNQVFEEDLVVDPNGGLANVMIYVKGKVKVHPDYDKTADATVVLDNKGCRFNPHVQGVRVGQTLQIKNSDPVAHNTNIVGRNLQMNPLIAAGTASDQKIEAPETLPAMVSCNIHPWMKGRILVRSNPYFAISGKDGSFEIKNLPAGDLDFIVYHERSGYVQDAELKTGKATWPKGLFKVTIEPGKDTDLGEIKLAAAQFNKD